MRTLTATWPLINRWLTANWLPVWPPDVMGSTVRVFVQWMCVSCTVYVCTHVCTYNECVLYSVCMYVHMCILVYVLHVRTYVFVTAHTYVHTVLFVENRPVDWPTDRLTNWPTDRPTDWLTDRLTDRMVIDRSRDQQSFLKVGLPYQLAILRVFRWPIELISPAVDSGDRTLHSLFEYAIFSFNIKFLTLRNYDDVTPLTDWPYDWPNERLNDRPLTDCWLTDSWLASFRQKVPYMCFTIHNFQLCTYVRICTHIHTYVCAYLFIVTYIHPYTYVRPSLREC